MSTMSTLISPVVQELVKFLFSTVSLLITFYFWYVRINREKVALKVYPVGDFEGALQDNGEGIWSGRIFIANSSILPTAVVSVKAELWWDGRWLEGPCAMGEGSELPWNMPPSQVFPRDLRAAFLLPPDTTREEVYANHSLRFTFETVDGSRITTETETASEAESAHRIAA